MLDYYPTTSGDCNSCTGTVGALVGIGVAMVLFVALGIVIYKCNGYFCCDFIPTMLQVRRMIIQGVN